MLPRPSRLTKATDYVSIYRRGRQYSTPHLRLFVRSSNQNISRFGFVVSKKQVAKIVARNRLKRMLRGEVIRLQSRLAPGRDVVIQGRPGIAAQIATPAAIRREFAELLVKARILQE